MLEIAKKTHDAVANSGRRSSQGELAKSAPRPLDGGFAREDVRRPDAESAEGDAEASRVDAGLGVDLEEEFVPDKAFKFDSRRAGGALAFKDGHEIVHVPGVEADPEAVLGEMVKGVEVAVREKLGGERPYRKTPRALSVPVYDPIDKRESLSVGNAAPDDRLERAMVDRREVAPDVALVDVGTAPGSLSSTQEALDAVDGVVGPVSDPAGVRVVDEPTIQDRLDHLDESVVDYAIAKRRRRYEPALGIVDPEFTQRKGMPHPPDEFVLERDEICFQVGGELELCPPVSLAARGGLVGDEEVLEVDDCGPNIVCCFHAAKRRRAAAFGGAYQTRAAIDVFPNPGRGATPFPRCAVRSPLGTRHLAGEESRPEADVAVHVRAAVIQVQLGKPGIRAVVPAAPDDRDPYHLTATPLC